MEPSSSTKLVDTSTLTSTTTKVGTLVQQDVPAPILTTICVVDMPLPDALHVCNDFMADATTNESTKTLVVI